MQFEVTRNSFPFRLYKLPGIYKTERMCAIQPRLFSETLQVNIQTSVSRDQQRYQSFRSLYSASLLKLLFRVFKTNWKQKMSFGKIYKKNPAFVALLIVWAKISFLNWSMINSFWVLDPVWVWWIGYNCSSKMEIHTVLEILSSLKLIHQLSI